jgi:hypothetical protein
VRPSECLRIVERELALSGASVPTPIMLWGPPGVGKSRIVEAVATGASVPLVDIRLAQMEPTDLRGIPFREGSHVIWATPTLLPDASRHGPRGILFLDEITSAVPTVTAAAYQLILDRRLGEYRVPPGWILLAAGNRHGDRGVTYAMPAPLANRFVHYEIEPDLDDWVRWAFANGIDTRIVAFLRFRPDLLFHFDPERQTAAFPTPRSWEYAHRALAKLGDEPALLRESLKGCVGAAAAAAFGAYLQHVEVLPDPARIVAGEAIAVPRSVELQYALATAIVQHVARLPAVERDRALTPVLQIARHFPQREIGVMLVTDLHRTIERPLYDVPGFAEWAAELGELMSFERA